jgi:hypothetical protein
VLLFDSWPGGSGEAGRQDEAVSGLTIGRAGAGKEARHAGPRDSFHLEDRGRGHISTQLLTLRFVTGTKDKEHSQFPASGQEFFLTNVLTKLHV